jgi:hypothetical protein
MSEDNKSTIMKRVEMMVVVCGGDRVRGWVRVWWWWVRVWVCGGEDSPWYDVWWNLQS